MGKTFREIINFIIGVVGLFMLAYGADAIGHKLFGESYFAFIGFALIGVVLVWQKNMSDTKDKEKNQKIEDGKRVVYKSLDELKEAIDESYRHYEFEKDTAEKLLHLVNKASDNTYNINRKY